MEDKIFKEFCKSNGLDNIRQYEEKQLSKQQEKAKKRLEFANHQSKLQSQLDFEKRRNTKGQVIINFLYLIQLHNLQNFKN